MKGGKNREKASHELARLPVVTLQHPKFASEAEEAEWWHTHREEADEHFERAYRAGAVHTVRAGRPAPETMQTTIRLISADVARARVLAERKGLRYQTYLKMLIHEAIEREGRVLD
jgi:predicted DNA binding CopG/RHH family protein